MIEKIANQYSDSATHFTSNVDALLNFLVSTNIIFVKNVFTTKEKCSRNLKQFTYKNNEYMLCKLRYAYAFTYLYISLYHI